MVHPGTGPRGPQTRLVFVVGYLQGLPLWTSSSGPPSPWVVMSLSGRLLLPTLSTCTYQTEFSHKFPLDQASHSLSTGPGAEQGRRAPSSGDCMRSPVLSWWEGRGKVEGESLTEAALTKALLTSPCLVLALLLRSLFSIPLIWSYSKRLRSWSPGTRVAMDLSLSVEAEC